MGLGVANLFKGGLVVVGFGGEGQRGGGDEGRGGDERYFDFEEVFGWAVDLFEALLAGVGHGLHLSGWRGVVGWGGRR